MDETLSVIFCTTLLPIPTLFPLMWGKEVGGPGHTLNICYVIIVYVNFFKDIEQNFIQIRLDPV